MIETSAFDTLRIEQRNGVLVAALDRGDTLNALTPEMVDELTDLMARVRQDWSVRAVVITGSGRAFSAGGDIEEDAVPVSRMTPWEYHRNVERYAAPMIAIAELDRPVIAAINGAAVGGGWDLALACDIRIASSKARFMDAYVRLGVMPELGGTYFLPRLAGLGRAKLLSFTGDFVSADQALAWGLVEEVVAPEDLDSHVRALAERIARGPSKAIAATKLAMNQALGQNLREAIESAKAVSSSLVSSPDFREAISAFLEKRDPRFDGAPVAEEVAN